MACYNEDVTSDERARGGRSPAANGTAELSEMLSLLSQRNNQHISFHPLQQDEPLSVDELSVRVDVES